MKWLIPLLVMASPVLGADIIQVTGGNFRLVKGDLLTLEVDPSEEPESVEWWSEGKLVCETLRCDIDTLNFTPGENQYDVVVKDSAGIAMDRIIVSADPAPPVYIPQKVRPGLASVGKNYVKAGRGQWLAIARSGYLLQVDEKSKARISSVRSLGVLNENGVYKAPEGSQILLVRIGESQEWYISAPATFRLRNGEVTVESGKVVYRQTTGFKGGSAPLRAGEGGWGIQADGPVFVELNMTKRNATAIAIVKLHSGAELTFSCPGAADRKVRTLTGVVWSAEAGCGATSEVPVSDPESMIRQWLPWWLDGQEPLAADRWRPEIDSFQADLPLSALIKLGGESVVKRECAEFMDAAGLLRNKFGEDPRFQQAIATCLHELKLYRAALSQLKIIESTEFDPAWSAFMTGKTLAGLGQHPKALEWYELARVRKFADMALLAEFASKSAEVARYSSSRLRWLETWALNEPAQDKIPGLWFNAREWKSRRPYGANLDVAFLMDGQALPVNSKKLAEMPGDAPTARSTLWDFKGTWFLTHPIGIDSTIVASGLHTFRRPFLAALAVGQSSLHEGSIGLRADSPGSFVSAGQGGFLLGTGVSGNERQRDLMGWYGELSKTGSLEVKARFESRKYLDPNPEGSDVIDLDLNRYTGPADHSHIDSVIRLSMSSPGADFAWVFRAGYSVVDYRVEEMAPFDHTKMDAEAEFLVPLSVASEVSVRPAIETRNFSSAAKQESLVGGDVILRLHTEPLWIAKLIAGAQTRTVSGDEISSYNRHYYGFGLSRDF